MDTVTHLFMAQKAGKRLVNVQSSVNKSPTTFVRIIIVWCGFQTCRINGVLFNSFHAV